MAEENILNVEKDKETSNMVKTEEIRMDKKVVVRSIAPWITGSSRKTTQGDINIPPMGTVLLSREEIIAQGLNGNTLLTGIDGVGGHATWYVEDKYVREELSFEVNGKTQDFLTKEKIKEIFDLKTEKAFKKQIKECVVTRAEKIYLLNMIKELKFNDYTKNAFCEEHSGYRLNEI